MTNPVLKEIQRQRCAEQDAREQALAAETCKALGYVPPAIDHIAEERLRPFLTFCAVRGVIHLPARCETVAAFLVAHSDLLPAVDRIIEILEAIEALHDAHLLASPCRSSIVAAAISRWPRSEPPRSWPDRDKLSFLQLPLMAQHVIARRETQRDREIRRVHSARDKTRDNRRLSIV